MRIVWVVCVCLGIGAESALANDDLLPIPDLGQSYEHIIEEAVHSEQLEQWMRTYDQIDPYHWLDRFEVEHFFIEVLVYMYLQNRAASSVNKEMASLWQATTTDKRLSIQHSAQTLEHHRWSLLRRKSLVEMVCKVYEIPLQTGMQLGSCDDYLRIIREMPPGSNASLLSYLSNPWLVGRALLMAAVPPVLLGSHWLFEGESYSLGPQISGIVAAGVVLGLTQCIGPACRALREWTHNKVRSGVCEVFAPSRVLGQQAQGSVLSEQVVATTDAGNL